MYFQINGRSSHSAQCVKSQITNKAIDSILSIEILQQQCIEIGGMLQSTRVEDHMKTIAIDQYLCNGSSFEHNF